MSNHSVAVDTANPSVPCIHALFEAHAAARPAAPAVLQDGTALSYAELNARANRLAHHLRAQGVGPETLVALCLERSADLLVALLAVWKAGGAYLPLDPAYPPARLAYMLGDARPALALGHEPTRAVLAAACAGLETPPSLLDLAADAARWADLPTADPGHAGLKPDQLAYVIYTSGSTGAPKGVMVEHGGVLNMARAQAQTFGIGPDGRVLQFASFSFDASAFETVLALAHGAALQLAPRGQRLAGEALLQLLRQDGITHATLPPAVLAALPPDAELPATPVLILAGEALPPGLARRWGQGRRLFNAYGPTEATVWASVHLCDPASEAASVPIGRAIAGAGLYLLDEVGEPVAPGEIGEIHIGGAGVARGYLGRPELTAERFVARGSERLYRTGDLGRLLPDGNLEYLGRDDFQVKLRGFRIELGEIEAQLVRCPGVREAVVLAYEPVPGDKRLVAYYLADEEAAPAAAALRLQLAAALPAHMLPAAYVRMPSWPLTPNGKLDRQALPAPAQRPEHTPYVAPRNGTEQALAEIWAEVLHVEPVGVDDDFLALGGHSLSAVRLATRVRERFGRQLPLNALFGARTVAGLAGLLAEAAADEGGESLCVEADSVQTGPIPLSYQQGAIWLLEALSPGTLAYNAQSVIRIRGRIDPALLQQALDAVVARHEIFRTTFHDAAGAPCQQIHPHARAALERVDLSDMAGSEAQAAALARVVEQTVRRPFVLATLPLVRWALVQLGRDEHALVHVEHHFVHDGWSANLFLQELLALYGYYSGAQAAPPPAPPAQYRHYARWQRGPVAESRYRQQLAYWKRKLAGVPMVLPLATDFPRPAMPSYRGRQLRLEFPAELNAGIRALCQAEGVTPFTVLLAAFQILLCRYCASEDLLIGSTVANRKSREAERMLGMFVNSVVIRSDVAGDPTFRELLARVRGTVMDAYDHAEVPFERVVRELQPSRSISHNPLFQVGFSFHSSDVPALAGPGFSMSLFEAYSNQTCKFDFEIVLIPRGSDNADTITLLWNYATDLFSADTMARMRDNYLRLLADCLARPGVAIGRLESLAEGERQQLLVDWNRAEDFAAAQTLPQLFAAQVAAAPEAVALVHEGDSLSYGELDRRANRLAHHLRAQGVGPDVLVAICAERSLEMVVGLLAVLKAGGAYVPLDPAYPAERLAYMLADSRPLAVLSHGPARAALGVALADLPAKPPVFDLDADWRHFPDHAPEIGDLAPHHLAYVIYTSGSTGQPKGVMVEQRNVARLFSATERWFGFGANDVWTLFHSFAFDFSVWEIWGALLHGGKLVIVPRATSRDPEAFYGLLCEQRVTVLNQTPSAFRSLVAAQAGSDARHALRTVIFGGEALDTAQLKPWYRDGRNAATQLVNMYGITETTVHVTYRPLSEADCDKAGSPIGERIGDLRLYLLDAHGAPVPIGVAGELHVGGAGVARGYLNRPELTAERFVASPFVAGDRLYKTGDLGRYRADGSLEYLGRNDFQVKIRGFRIELGEIESVLQQQPGVREAVVLARPDAAGEQRLVAYYTAVAEPAGADVLRRQLAAVLPEHMVPAAYVAVAHWPLTANGKLDRKALPEPDGQAFGERRYAAPEGPVETALAAIWAEVLGLERIGRHDHFFELGGHSLLALRVLERMRRQGLHADVRVLFGTPTLAALAAAVGNESSQDIVPPNLIEPGCERITPELLPLVALSQDEIDRIVAGVPGGAANVQDIYPLAPLQEGILFHHLMAKEHDPYLLASLIRFRDRSRLDAYLEALEAVIARHDILRTAFAWEGLGEPVQVVWRQAPLLVDECELDPTQGDAGTQLRQKAERRLPLQQAPLMRLLLARDPHTGQWLALKQFHHIIDDNTSLKHLNAEIRVHLAGGADQLPPALPFRDYVAQTRRGAARAEHEAFFRKMLGGIDAPTAPFGLLDVRGDGHRMQQVRQAVDAALSQRLRAQAQALGVSAASLFHVAWGQVLARTTGRSAVVFGTVLFGRMQGGEGSDRILGPFINTLPLRVDLGETGAAACVRQTHQALTELIRHEHASLALAQRCSAVAPPAPLFTSLLNYRHGATLAEAAAVADAAGLDGIEHLHTDERTNYPLTLSIDDLRDDFRLTVQVCGEVDAARVCGMLQHALASLADALEQAPVRALGRLDVLPDEERRRLLVEWNGPAADYPRDRCLHQLFEDQAARHPAAVAVACEDAQLSYGELNARANRLARHLQAQGVGPDRRVAICAERSLEMVVALLAVLKAGGAYVPLDPDYPAERLAHMLRDSAPAAVLSHGPARAALAAALAELPAAPPAIDLDADAAAWADRPAGDLAAAAQASDLAYVIYTSGSTGLPKGAMNEHRAVVNRLMWMQDEYRLGRDDAVLQKTPFSFDVSVWEFFWPLLAGARLVMARPGGHKDPAYLARTIAERRITTLHFVPSMLEVFLQHPDAAQCTSLRHVVCSGEALPAALAAQARAALPEAGLHNLYGPTEAAVDVTAWTCPRDGVPPVVPIGRPIANTAIYILDALQQPVPQGVAGEIHIGGVQVGRGYLNRPELTAERFPADPFSADPRARMYRTGDLGRWLADGQIEYLGRNDFQVKLRGFRIELGEIEARLAACPGVQSAVVLAREDQAGNPRLVGYFVAAGDAPADEALRKWLGAALPDYMVPAAFVPLARWPLTPNGKLDRKALPAPEAAALDARAYVAPRTPIEAAMAEIWADVLRLDRVGVQDNFFDLGGHSLLAARVATRIQESLGVELPLRVLFDSPTIEDVLEYIFAEFEDAQA